MFVPAGYVTVSEISFWLAEIFNKKWDTMKGSLPPDFRNSPECLKTFDDSWSGEDRGALRRLLLLTCLKEKIENLYLCRPDLTVVRAGPYILNAINSSNTRQIYLMFLDGEYKHVGITEFWEKLRRVDLNGELNAEAWQAAAESLKKLELHKSRLTFPSYLLDDFVQKNAPVFANLAQKSPKYAKEYSYDETLNLWKASLRGVFGGLAGAHLVVKEADAVAVQAALAGEADSLILRIKNGVTAAINEVALELKINRPGASIPGESLADRIIEEIEKAKGAEKTFKKDDIINALYRPGVVTYRELFKAWGVAVSRPDHSDMSKRGPKPKRPE